MFIGINLVYFDFKQIINNRIKILQVSQQACNEWCRSLWSNKYNECWRPVQMSKRRVDQVGILPAIFLLLSLWVCIFKATYHKWLLKAFFVSLQDDPLLDFIMILANKTKFFFHLQEIESCLCVRGWALDIPPRTKLCACVYLLSH